jgi:hypothetical protein
LEYNVSRKQIGEFIFTKENFAMKTRDIELVMDFVRWFDAEFPDNNRSSEELLEWFEPHIQEYWSPENVTDDCHVFFSQLLEREGF